MTALPAWLGSLWAISCVALGAIPAEATPISFDFSGIVRQIESAGPGIELGCAVSGRYTFESTTPDTRPHGAYDFALLGIELFLDGRRVEFSASESNRIWVWDANHSAGRGAADSYRVLGSAQHGFIDGIAVEGPLALSLNLVAIGEAPFADSVLPVTPVHVDDFMHAAYFQITVDTAVDQMIVRGRVTSITPEPGSGALLGLGLILLGWRRARRA